MPLGVGPRLGVHEGEVAAEVGGVELAPVHARRKDALVQPPDVDASARVRSGVTRRRMMAPTLSLARGEVCVSARTTSSA